MKGFIEVTNVDKGASGEKWLVNVSQISYVAPKSGSYGVGNCVINSGVAGFSLNVAETYTEVIMKISRALQ